MDFFKYQGLKGGPFQIYGTSFFEFWVFFKNAPSRVNYSGRCLDITQDEHGRYRQSSLALLDTMAADTDFSDTELQLDDIFGGPVLDDDARDVAIARLSENLDPNVPFCRPGKPKTRLPWVSVGLYEGETCTADAEASLKTHALEPWFEPRGRKCRTVRREGIPLTQTPRRLADGTVVSEFRCPFSQVPPPGRTLRTALFLKSTH